MTRAEEDALLSDLAEVEHHMEQVRWAHLKEIDRAYVAKVLRHALQIVEGEKP
jgi:hypothetical protein